MSAAKHTPGPWQVVEATEYHGFYVVSDYGPTVCDLYAMSNPLAASTRNGGTSYPIRFLHGQDGANARLIAAAPELLEALERIVECDGARPGHVAFLTKDQIIARARAAIAKAKGVAA